MKDVDLIVEAILVGVAVTAVATVAFVAAVAGAPLTSLTLAVITMAIPYGWR